MNDIYIKREKKKGLFGVIGGMIKGVMIAGLIILLIGFAGGIWCGYNVWGTAHTEPTYSQMLQGQNDLIAEKNKNYMTEVAMTNSEIEALKTFNANLQATNERLVNEQIENSIKITQLKIQVESKDREIARLKSTANMQAETTVISPITPVQTTQITPSTSTATYAPAFNYGSWAGRPTYPSIKYFATVTNNVMKFTEGKTFEQIVDGIRGLRYISHVNDNGNYAIQHADETLVIGGGDCTDKVLLLYSCMKYLGHSEDDMAVVSIHSCDGGYDHNVLAMTKPPFDATGVDAHYTFDIGGRKWYIIDPTNWAGTPMCSVMAYYEDCYIVGNMHFYNTDTLGGWDKVPMHGLKVKR